MIALDLPPQSQVDILRSSFARPAIIRPIEHKLLRSGFLPANRAERRAALKDLIARGVITPDQAKRALVGFFVPAAGWAVAAGGGGAFPVVEATNTSGSTGTTQTVALPAGIQAGDLLIILFAGYEVLGIGLAGAPSGWSTLYNILAENESQDIIGAAFYKVADGSEGASVGLTAGNTLGAHCSYRISGYQGTPEATTGDSAGNQTQPNPPSLTPSWGSADTLWLVVAGGVVARTLTSPPADYGDSLSFIQTTSGSSGHTSIHSARRELTASSEDPGAFTLNNPQRNFAATIAIQPA